MNDIPDKVSPASARVSVQDADRYRAPASGRAEGMALLRLAKKESEGRDVRNRLVTRIIPGL
jgi:hypothetical protein